MISTPWRESSTFQHGLTFINWESTMEQLDWIWKYSLMWKESPFNQPSSIVSINKEQANMRMPIHATIQPLTISKPKQKIETLWISNYNPIWPISCPWSNTTFLNRPLWLPTRLPVRLYLIASRLGFSQNCMEIWQKILTLTLHNSWKTICQSRISSFPAMTISYAIRRLLGIGWKILSLL